MTNKLITLALAGIGLFCSNNANSQDTIRTHALLHDYAEYKYGRFGIELEEIFALDRNRDSIADGVLKVVTKKKFLGKKSSTYQIWTDSNDDGVFDAYQLIRRDFNFLGKEKSHNNFVSMDISEINKDYSLPMFDGKKFDWKNSSKK